VSSGIDWQARIDRARAKVRRFRELRGVRTVPEEHRLPFMCGFDGCRLRHGHSGGHVLNP
jgi:hypothetical protein